MIQKDLGSDLSLTTQSLCVGLKSYSDEYITLGKPLTFSCLSSHMLNTG